MDQGSLDLQEMEDYYERLKAKIQDLSQILNRDAMKQEQQKGNGFKVSETKKCTTFCQPLTHDREKCVRRCVQSVTPFHLFDGTKYQTDVKRLNADPVLKQNFIKFQTLPETIKGDPETMKIIKDVFAMPLAVEVFPPHAWGNMLLLMQKPEHEKDFYDLLSNWDLRQEAYSSEDKRRLQNILAVNDRGNRLKKMVDRVAA